MDQILHISRKTDMKPTSTGNNNNNKLRENDPFDDNYDND